MPVVDAVLILDEAAVDVLAEQVRRATIGAIWVPVNSALKADLRRHEVSNAQPRWWSPKSTTGRASLSFFFGVALGSPECAEKVSKTVRSMQDQISGVRPDGHAYRASDPAHLELLNPGLGDGCGAQALPPQAAQR